MKDLTVKMLKLLFKNTLFKNYPSKAVLQSWTVKSALCLIFTLDEFLRAEVSSETCGDVLKLGKSIYTQFLNLRSVVHEHLL